MILKIIKSAYSKTKLNFGIKKNTQKIIEYLKNIDFLRKIFDFFTPKFTMIDEKIETFVYLNLFRKLELFFSKRIINYYGADYRWHDEKSQNLNTKQGNFGYASIYYSILRNIKYENILCIGSMYGFIPYMLAAACRDNKQGVVHFVDPGYDIKKDKNHNYGQGFWKKVDVKKHFSYLGVNKYIKHYLMTSHEFSEKYPNLCFDFIYLDGDHSFQGAKSDFNDFWPKLKFDGFMCFHDIYKVEERPIHKGMKFEYWKIINKIKKRKDTQMIHFPHPIPTGIAIVQKLHPEK
jgi:hypothetical protein